MDYGDNPFASPEMQAMLQQQSAGAMPGMGGGYPYQGPEMLGMMGQPQTPMGRGAYPYSGPEMFGMMGQQAGAGYSMYGVMPPGVGMSQGYGFQGRMDASGYVKYSRQQMLDGLRNFVIMQTRVPISKEEKLEETPQFLRHACAQCGVSQLQMLQFNIPEAGISIPFYFCTACGKLFYYKDFSL